MRHRKRVVGQHEAAVSARTRDHFCRTYGLDATRRREAEIAALPVVAWKGKELRTIRCAGPFGKGPHDVNVPESLLWSLVDLRQFCCAYHR